MKLSIFLHHIIRANEQTGKPLSNILKTIKQSGIEAVDVRLQYLLEHRDVMETVKQSGLCVSCIFESFEMGVRDEFEKATELIDTAVQVGAKKVLVVPGFLDGNEAEQMQAKMPDQKELEVFMDENEKILRMKMNLSYIVNYGAQKGVLVMVEDFDDPKSPLSGVNGVDWFLKRVPGLWYTLDTGNYLYYKEDLLEVYDQLKDKVAHVHCKDRSRGDNCSVEIGTGYMPISQVVRCLKVQGYDGYLAIEHFGVEDYEQCAIKSANFLNEQRKL